MENVKLMRNADGTVMTADEIEDYFIERMIDEMDTLDTDDLLDLCNQYREENSLPRLYYNDYGELDDVLCDVSPSDLLYMGRDDWESSDEFFQYTYGSGLSTTDDVYEGIDREDVARDILIEEFEPDNLDVEDLLEEYKQAKLALKNCNVYRIETEEVIRKYTNCEADVTDLLQMLSKLARTNDVWKDGGNN